MQLIWANPFSAPPTPMASNLYFLVTSLLRYNLHTIQSPRLRCIVQCFLSTECVTITMTNFTTLLSPQKQTPHPLAVTPSPRLPQITCIFEPFSYRCDIIYGSLRHRTHTLYIWLHWNLTPTEQLNFSLPKHSPIGPPRVNCSSQ